MRIEVPIRLLGELAEGRTVFHYDLGAFSSREIPVTIGPGQHVDLRFRLPKELFRPRERLLLEVRCPVHEGQRNVLWTKRYEVGWSGADPYLRQATD